MTNQREQSTQRERFRGGVIKREREINTEERFRERFRGRGVQRESISQRFSEERERAINTEGEVQREVQRGSN